MIQFRFLGEYIIFISLVYNADAALFTFKYIVIKNVSWWTETRTDA